MINRPDPPKGLQKGQDDPPEYLQALSPGYPIRLENLLLHHKTSAIHINDCAGDVACFLGSEKNNGGSHLFRSSQSSQRDRLEHLLALAIAPLQPFLLDPFSTQDDARSHGIHQNSIGRDLPGQLASKPQESGLGAGIDDPRQFATASAGLGRYVDDPSPMPFLHATDDSPGTEEGSR